MIRDQSDQENNVQIQSQKSIDDQNQQRASNQSQNQNQKQKQNYSQKNSSSKEQQLNLKERKQKEDEQRRNQILKQIVKRSSQPRLIIQKIQLQNFKSYQGLQTIGPFHSNFTSIIGPNGSGKSNLIQSLMFVFGFNARWMRSNRLNQLIHNSALYRDAKIASVAVHFSKVIDLQEGKIEKVPKSDFYIKRSVVGISESKFEMNGRQCHKSQIFQKLKSENIDLANHRFLILQGQVQNIAQMKQKSNDPQKPGLLQFLEDIIGSNKFIEQIQKYTNKYNQVQQKKIQKGKLVKIMEGELKSIYQAKTDAVNFIKIQRYIFVTLNITCQIRHLQIQKQLLLRTDQLKELIVKKNQVMAQQKQKHEKKAKNLKQLKIIIDFRKAQQNKNKQNKQKCDQISTDLKIHQQQISFKTQDSRKYNKKKKQLCQEKQRIEKQYQQTKINLPILKQKFQKLSEEIIQIKKKLNQNDDQNIVQKINQCTKEVNVKKMEQENLRNNLDRVKKKQKKMQQEIIDYNSRIKDHNDNIQKKKQQKVITQFTKSKNQQIQKQQIKKIQKLKNQKLQFKSKLQQVQIKLKQIQSNNNEKQEFQNIFTKIIQENFQGVIGRLGDLGNPTQKIYDLIITTAIGPRLDNIVVKNFQAANKVIEFLKKKKLGRASCIILQEIALHCSNGMMKNFSLPQSAVRLFDKIVCQNQQNKIAFYFALGDTLYIQNSDDGAKYSYDKNIQFKKRIISKKKNSDQGFIVFEPNGLMRGVIGKTGGFDRKGKARKTQKQKQVIQQQKKQLKKQRQLVLNILQNIDEKIKTNKKEIDNLNIQKSSLQEKLKKLHRQICKQQDEVSQCLKYINKQKEKQQLSKLTKNNLQEQEQNLNNQLKKLIQQKEVIQQNLKQLISEQQNKQNLQIKMMRENYKELKKNYRQLDKQIERGQALISQTQVRTKKNQEQTKRLQKRIQKLKQDLDNLLNQQKQKYNEQKNILSKIQEIQLKIKQQKEHQDKLKIVLQDDKIQIQNSKKKVQKIKNQCKQSQEKVKIQEVKLQNVKQQIFTNRNSYNEIIKSYKFLNQLEKIQKMNIFKQQKENNNQKENQISIYEKKIQNQLKLLKTSRNQLDPNFPVEMLLDTSPVLNIEETFLNRFLNHYAKIKSMQQSLSNTKKNYGNIDINIILDFKQKFQKYQKMYLDYKDIKQNLQKLKKTIEDLKSKRFKTFRTGFQIINTKLKEVYRLLTNGGDADLQLIDALDPFSDGINFSVRPPKKAWKQINKLSGGQKTLSSLSLIFALHYYKPTPLYFMDEIDAALDFKNVSIVGQYIKKRTKNAQFIVISLRNNMFDLADKLVGVYKTYDQSKTATLLPNLYCLSNITNSINEEKRNLNKHVNTNINNEIRNNSKQKYKQNTEMHKLKNELIKKKNVQNNEQNVQNKNIEQKPQLNIIEDNQLKEIIQQQQNLNHNNQEQQL